MRERTATGGEEGETSANNYLSWSSQDSTAFFERLNLHSRTLSSPPSPMGSLTARKPSLSSIGSDQTSPMSMAQPVTLAETTTIPAYFYRHGVYVFVSDAQLVRKKNPLLQLLPPALSSSGQGYHEYLIEVRLLRPYITNYNNPSVTSYFIAKRYHEVRKFYMDFVRTFDKFVVEWPPCPKKTLFIDRFQPHIVTSRLNQFNNLLQFIALHPKLYNSQKFIDFLGYSPEASLTSMVPQVPKEHSESVLSEPVSETVDTNSSIYLPHALRPSPLHHVFQQNVNAKTL